MEKVPFPEELRRFVLTSIPSVPFLEALLLLRANPTQQWHADTLAQRLYVRERTAQRRRTTPATNTILLPPDWASASTRWPTCMRGTWSKSHCSSILPSTARPSNLPTPSNCERTRKWR